MYINSLPEAGFFYRKPLANRASGEICLSKQVVSKNTLAKIIPNMMKEAGIDTTDIETSLAIVARCHVPPVFINKGLMSKQSRVVQVIGQML